MNDTLVLNADGFPVSVIPLSAVSWKEAVLYIYHDKCNVLSWYDDWIVRSPSWETRVPAVIMLKNYLRRATEVRFSKHNVLLRDQYKCLYCETNVNNVSVTLDHVIPVSRGGKTNWTNIVTSCRNCNTRKGNRLDMKPIYKPYKPGYYELVRKRKQLPFNIRHDSWNKWLQLDE